MKPFDLTLAHSQGWFLCDNHDDEPLRLMKMEDHEDGFDNDEDAWRFVILQALKHNQDYHLRALRKIQAVSPIEWGRLVHKGISMGFYLPNLTEREIQELATPTKTGPNSRSSPATAPRTLRARPAKSSGGALNTWR